MLYEVITNIIYKTALAGIWIFGSGSYSASTANVHVHHNQIYDTGTKTSNSIIGGILSNGFSGLIENNVIDGAYGAGIVQKTVYSPAPSSSGFVITSYSIHYTKLYDGAKTRIIPQIIADVRKKDS